MKSLVVAIFVLFFAPGIIAQNRIDSCYKDFNAPSTNTYYWPSDTEVGVYFSRNLFTHAQQQSLLEAMKSWNAAAAQSGSGVKFFYLGESNGIQVCDRCLTITRREVHKHDHQHYAFFRPLQRDKDGLLVSAWIDIDFATTDAKALQGFMVHELGHSLGLSDCTRCKKKTTIMNGFPGINEDNGLIEPSRCDVEVVKEIYRLHRPVEGTVAGATSRHE
jgi:hypothetical protein